MECALFGMAPFCYVLMKECDQDRLCSFWIVALFVRCSYLNVFFLVCSLFTVEFKRIVL